MSITNIVCLWGYLFTTQVMRSRKSFMRNNTPIDVSGEWDTNWGKMVLNQKGNVVTGRYTWENGKIEGTLTGTTFEGYWSEIPSYECPKYKGKTELEFSTDGLTFVGKWGYCEEPFGGYWTGSKVTDKANEMPIEIDVTGSWKVSEGIMVLEQINSSVQGRYEGIDSLGRKNKGIVLGNISQDPLSKLFVFEGIWAGYPTFSCPENEGKLRMIFNSSKNQFKMNWSYCNEPISEVNVEQGSLIVGPEPLDIEGTWDTNIGPMIFKQKGSTVLGTYKGGKARLEGKIIGNFLSGDWYEANTYSCPYQRGRYEMIFTPDSKNFSGEWNYCDNEPDPSKVWIGSRL